MLIAYHNARLSSHILVLKEKFPKEQRYICRLRDLSTQTFHRYSCIQSRYLAIQLPEQESLNMFTSTTNDSTSSFIQG